MKLESYDDQTVTVKMNRREEFTTLCGLVSSVYTQYELMDEIELGMTRDEVKVLLRKMEEVDSECARVKDGGWTSVVSSRKNTDDRNP